MKNVFCFDDKFVVYNYVIAIHNFSETWHGFPCRRRSERLVESWHHYHYRLPRNALASGSGCGCGSRAAAATVCILHVILRHGTNVRRKLLYTNNVWVYRCREPHDWSYSKFQRGYSDINRNQGFTRLWSAFFYSRVRRVTFRRGTAINKIHLESLQTTQLRIMQS